MGLIRAASAAAGGFFADQWKEYFYCDSLDSNTLVAKGKKRISGRSSNKKGDDNIITDKSVIAVNEGQCMMIVEDGAIAELCAEPGEFIYDSDASPSVFSGDLTNGISKSVNEIWERFKFGGDAGRDGRVYYFNIKEISGNKYGTASPVPFRVIDRNIGLDIDISVRCNGEYSYRIVNPVLFYTNVCGNVTDVFCRDKIDSMLKTEILTALQPAFAKVSSLGVRYSALPAHAAELTDIMNEVLSKKWTELRGIAVYSFGINSISAPREDEEMIKNLQKSAVMRDPSMAAASLVEAEAEALKSAAKNSAGAMNGFMGMNMASAVAGGEKIKYLYHLTESNDSAGSNDATRSDKNLDENKENSWKCSCGEENDGKFCSECGTPRPSGSSWKCGCGTINSGKFCSECGASRPSDAPWKCSCGAENKGKFCSECGKQKF